MATQKIKMRHKTATGYDLVHPETVATQVYVDEKQLPDWLLENYVNIKKNIEDGVLDTATLDSFVAYIVENGEKKAKGVNKTSFLKMLKTDGSFFGCFDSLENATDSIPENYAELGWENFQVFCFATGQDGSFSIGLFMPGVGFLEVFSFTPGGDGINIVVAETDPGNLNVGDWWYEVIPEVAP